MHVWLNKTTYRRESVHWMSLMAGVAWSLLLAIGQIYRIKLARILTIFYLCLVGLVSVGMLFLTVPQMLPLKYMTANRETANGIALLCVSGAFLAAR